MTARFTLLTSLLAVAALGAGCANDTSLSSISTASVQPQTVAAPKIDPACITIAAQIDTLRKDGVQEKIEKAAAKKYKMKTEDLAHADQLNKANAEFQAKCGPSLPRPVTAQAPSTTTTAAIVPPVDKKSSAIATKKTVAANETNAAAPQKSTPPPVAAAAPSGQ